MVNIHPLSTWTSPSLPQTWKYRLHMHLRDLRKTMKIPPGFLAPFIFFFYRLWCSTLRITESGRERVNGMESAGEVMMFPIWHDELFPLMHIRGTLRIVTVVSQSTDGEYLARLLEALGMKTVRGSSSKGGIKALLKASSLMRREGYNGCITVDGPRGPRHIAKPGAVILAFRSAASVVPIRVFMKNGKRFRSWDRFQLPWPFSRVHIAWGEPYVMEATDLSERSVSQERARLELRLESMQPPVGCTWAIDNCRS